MLYSQLGITDTVMDGTADDKTETDQPETPSDTKSDTDSDKATLIKLLIEFIKKLLSLFK